MALFKMTTARGSALNIPVTSILSVESCREGKVSGLIEAPTFLRYDIGQGCVNVHLLNGYDAIVTRLIAEHPDAKNWCEFELWEPGRFGPDVPRPVADRVFFDPGRIFAVEGQDPENGDGMACLATVRFTPPLGAGHDTSPLVFLGLMSDADYVTERLEARENGEPGLRIAKTGLEVAEGSDGIG